MRVLMKIIMKVRMGIRVCVIIESDVCGRGCGLSEASAIYMPGGTGLA